MGHHHSFPRHHHQFGHHHHHNGAGRALAEAALVGGVAVTAAAMASRSGRRPYQQPLPRAEVVRIEGGPQYSAVQPYTERNHHCGGHTVVINQAAPEAPLDVRSVRLVPEAIEVRGEVVFFGVEVVPQSGDPWRVMRRYQNFVDLRKELGPQAMFFPGAPFPRKHLFRLGVAKLEARRAGLEMWLRRALEAPMSAGFWLRPLRHFLEGGRQSISHISHYSQQQPQAMSAGMPAQPMSPQPAVPEPITTHQDGVVLQIQIPAGVTAGQLLGVTVPGGSQLNVAVPSGVVAGQTVDLFYDPAAASLVPLL